MPSIALCCTACHKHYDADRDHGLREACCPECGRRPTWRYLLGGQDQGPVYFAQLQQEAVAGRLRPGGVVLPEGTTQWQPVGTLGELLRAANQAAGASPATVAASAESKGRPVEQPPPHSPTPPGSQPETRRADDLVIKGVNVPPARPPVPEPVRSSTASEQPPYWLAGPIGVGVIALLTFVIGPCLTRQDEERRDRIQEGQDALASGDYDRAIERFDEYLQRNPESYVTLIDRGDAYRGKGDRAKALADYTQAIEKCGAVLQKKPGDSHTLTCRGNGYLRIGEPARAVADYDEAIASIRNQKSTGLFRLQTGPVHARRGEAYLQKGDYGRAADDFTEAIRQGENPARNFRSRGIAYGRQGDHDRAIADLSQSLQLAPHAGEVKQLLGNAYYTRAFERYKRDSRDKAIEDLTRAIEMDPGHAPAYFLRSVAYFAAGDQKRSDADYKEAVRLDPSLAIKATK
jgi:tetratricopeptide (TPR) repeat protein